MALHELKAWPEFFQPVMDGTKTFEIRKNDRNFKVGDRLMLREFKPCPRCHGSGREQWDAWDSGACGCNETAHPRGNFTGRTFEVDVVYITDHAQREGYVVMSIKPVPMQGGFDGRTT